MLNFDIQNEEKKVPKEILKRAIFKIIIIRQNVLFHIYTTYSIRKFSLERKLTIV